MSEKKGSKNSDYVAKIERAKRALTAEQLQILKSKQLKGNFIPSKLIKLMKALSLFDEVGDLIRKKIHTKGIVTGLFAFLFFVLTICGIIYYSDLSAYFQINYVAEMICVLLGLLFIFFFQLSRKVSSESKAMAEYDLNNNFRNFVLPLVGILKEEVKAGTKINLDLNTDSSELSSDNYFVSKQQSREFYGRNYFNYLNPWLNVSVTFCDDSKVEIKTEKRYQKIKITKRSSSGKTKYKTKHKYTDVTQVKVIFSKEQYNTSAYTNKNIRQTETDAEIIVKGKFSQKSNEIIENELNQFLNFIHKMYSTVKPIAL